MIYEVELMKKKTLEKKIRHVLFWTLGGIFGYLVIALFLKSNYPIFQYDLDRATAYDVIKDALTLAAAFLAPVAAFVLFSDWRDQHREINQENQASKIYNMIELIFMKLRTLNFNLLDRALRDDVFYTNIGNEFKEINLQHQDLVIICNNVIVSNESMHKFMKTAIKIIKEDCVGLIGSLGMIVDSQRILDFPEDYRNLFLEGETVDEFIDRHKRSFPISRGDSLDEVFYKTRVDIEQLYQELIELKV